MRPIFVAAANAGCFCLTLPMPRVLEGLDQQAGRAGFGAALMASHPDLLSSTSLFIASDQLRQMRDVVGAIETVTRLPGYVERVLAWAPKIAALDHGPAGVMMGYDFHLGEDGPRLIEINTNAGGAFINAPLAEAQNSCCRQSRRPAFQDAAAFDETVVAMFQQEWTRQGRPGPLRNIAIVDEAPQGQYLYPDMELAAAMLAAQGYGATICDPSELRRENGRILIGGEPVDLIYNRLTDFALADPAHRQLRDAYVAGEVVLTPSPRHHALHADKRNLSLLSDPDVLKEMGASEETRAMLVAAVPATSMVTHVNADALWARRRELFFKPASGFGSKATYRGSKLTKRVWSEIRNADYVAQQFAPPGSRAIRRDGDVVDLKVDVRLYTYEAKPLLAAARLYQGQTTNMRTPGGGFAPVLEIDEAVR